VETAQKNLTDELSLDNRASALSRLQTMLQENHVSRWNWPTSWPRT
jgi:hypothetical protein